MVSNRLEEIKNSNLYLITPKGAGYEAVKQKIQEVHNVTSDEYTVTVEGSNPIPLTEFTTQGQLDAGINLKTKWELQVCQAHLRRLRKYK
jgi:hypothetical protein